MAKKKIILELRDLSDGELEKKSEEVGSQLYELRRKQATGQIDNPARLKTLRRDRARMLTLLSERVQGR